MVLLIEDNESISSGLKFSLEVNKFEVIVSNSISSAIKELENNLDIIILDVFLPDGNGFQFYEDYVKSKNIPTIFLTAKDSEEDIVSGLELGADDYITKPFSTKELITRINKVVGRLNKNDIIKVKDITFDLSKMEVFKNNIKLNLSSLELNILKVLFTNLNKVVTRDVLLERIWEWTGNDVDDHTLTVYLKRIKDKLDSDIIVTLKKVGYRIDEEQNRT